MMTEQNIRVIPLSVVKIRLLLIVAVSLLWLGTTFRGAAGNGPAAVLQLRVVPAAVSNEFAATPALEWTAALGFRYTVELATNLGAGGFTAVDAVKSEGGLVRWVSPEPLKDRRYYRVATSAAVFDVQPTFLSSDDPDAALYLMGQGLPTNPIVVISGQNFSATATTSNGVWRVPLSGLPPGQPVTGSISVLDPVTSNVVATLPVQYPIFYGSTSTAEQLQGPVEEPPASPTALLAMYLSKKGYDYWKAKSELRSAGANHNPVFQENGNAGQMPELSRFLSKKGYDYYQAQSDMALAVQEGKKGINAVNVKSARVAGGANEEEASQGGPQIFEATGELRWEETDLVIPGAMLDFAWTRTYRSRTGPTTAQGTGWDFSFNVSLTQNGDGTLTLRPGNGRADTFYPAGTNGWIRDEYFCQVIDLNGDGFPDVRFADTGRWLFHPLGTPAGGKLAQIIDRNGNTISLNYDAKGRLAEIVDDVGRTNTVAYNAKNQIASVTDFSGRAVRYEYDGHGDLVAVISPSVVGTPTGNDFPGGITNRYSYTSGNADERLNHNLTTCTDGQGQLWLQVGYQPTNNPASIDFDRIDSVQTFRANGVPAGQSRLRAYPQSPDLPNNFAVTKIVVRDAFGNVSEGYYDSRQRGVRRLEYTGRAPDLTAPTTETDNRPTGKLRIDDPDYFETKWSWTSDSLCALETLPDGGSTQFLYERDLNPGVNARKKGDCRVLRQFASGPVDLDGDGSGDISERTWHFSYDPRFGSPAVARKVHGLHRGDHQPSAARGKKLFVGNLPVDAGDGGELAVVAQIDRMGRPAINTALNSRLAPGGNGVAIKTKGTGADKDRVGLATPVRVHDWAEPNGVAIKTKGTGADKDRTAAGDPPQAPSAASYTREKLKGTVKTQGDFNLANRFSLELDFCTSATDPRGNASTAAFDNNGNCAKVTGPSLAVSNCGANAPTINFAYNPQGQLTAITNVPDGNCYRRVDRVNYYAAGPQAGQVQSIVIDEPGMHLTSSFEYDAVGHLTRYVDPRANDWLFVYNALDWCILRQTPTNRTARCTEFATLDANGNLQDSSRELLDENDNFIGTIVTHFKYDALDRCIAVAEPVAAGIWLTNRFDYDANGRLTSVQSPLAASGADPGAAIAYEYDERGLLFREMGAPGTSAGGTNEWSYDAGGRVARYHAEFYVEPADWSDNSSRPIAPRQKRWLCSNFRLRCDGLGRLAFMTNEMGDVLSWTYDRNDNCTLIRCLGETNDIPGSAGNLLLAQTRYAYDSLDRCAQEKDSLFDPASGLPLGKGTSSTTYAYAPNGDCTSVTDDNGHTTSYSFDTAGRVYSVSVPAGKRLTTCARDAVGQLTALTITDQPDGGGATQQFALNYSYDALNRCTSAADNVGNTNRFAYDSLSRCLSAADPQGHITWYRYDDLGRCTLAVCDLDGDGLLDLATDAAQNFAYDDNSRCVAVADANTNITRYAYDSLGRCTSVTNADGTTMKLIWSPRSNLMAVEYPNGTTATNTYDLCNGVIHRDLACRNVLATTTYETFAYDGLGRCVVAQNDASLCTFAYDSRGRCLRTTQDGLTTGYTYDGVGNNLSVSYPGGRTVSYTYNEVNNLSSLSSSAGGGLPSVLLATYTYAGPGRLLGIVRANGVNTTRQWDGQINPANGSGDFGWMQVRGISHAKSGLPVDQRRCEYDRNQNRVSRAMIAPALVSGLETNLFARNAADRQHHFVNLRASGVSAFEDLILDKMGNRLAETNETFTGVYSLLATLPPGDFQMNRYSVTPLAQCNYDLNGNLTTSATATGQRFFAYDYANRLVQVSAPDAMGGVSLVASYAYDALGRRISKTAYPASPLQPPVTTYFVKGEQCDDGGIRSDDGCDLEERILGSTSSMVYCWGGSADFVCFANSSTPFYAHADDLGNLLALTDAAGSVLERYSYGAFGAPTFLTADGVVKTGSDGLEAKVSDFGMSRLFRGLEWDDAVGLYKFRGRMNDVQSNPLYEETHGSGQNPFYDPSSGRSLTRRPVCASGQCSDYDPLAGNPWSGGEALRNKYTVTSHHITLIK